MKKNLCFFVVSMLLSMNSNAQDITTASIAMLDSLRSAGTRVAIRYVPKPEPVPNEFFSIHLGAFIAEIPVSNTPLDNAVFGDAKDVYHIINKEGIFIYLSGEFKELSDAVIEKYRLSKKGQRSVYVVKVIDRRKVIIVE